MFSPMVSPINPAVESAFQRLVGTDLRRSYISAGVNSIRVRVIASAGHPLTPKGR